MLYPLAVFVVFGVCLLFRDFRRDYPGMSKEVFAGERQEFVKFLFPSF